MPARGKALGHARSVRGLPVDTGTSFTRRREGNPLAVRRPHRILVRAGIERESGERLFATSRIQISLSWSRKSSADAVLAATPRVNRLEAVLEWLPNAPAVAPRERHGGCLHGPARYTSFRRARREMGRPCGLRHDLLHHGTGLPDTARRSGSNRRRGVPPRSHKTDACRKRARARRRARAPASLPFPGRAPRWLNRRCSRRRTGCVTIGVAPGMNSGKTELFTLAAGSATPIRDRTALGLHPSEETTALRREYDGVVGAPSPRGCRYNNRRRSYRRSALNRHLLQVGSLEIRNPIAVRRKERPAHVRDTTQRRRIGAIEIAYVQLALCRAGDVGETASIQRNCDVGSEGVDRQWQVSLGHDLESHGPLWARHRAGEEQRGSGECRGDCSRPWQRPPPGGAGAGSRGSGLAEVGQTSASRSSETGRRRDPEFALSDPSRDSV